MRNYTITINGKACTVTIEEGTVSSIAAAPAAPVAAPATPAASAATPAPATAPTGTTGSVSVSAPIPGRVVAVKTAAGQAMGKGDVILVLGAMKMKSDVVTPQDGAIANINASIDDSVESGTISAALS